MNYGWSFMTLYRRQGSRPFPRNSCEKKRGADAENGLVDTVGEGQGG